MKKFLFLCAISLSFTVAMATETNVMPENDVGYVVPDVPTFEVNDILIEAWQAPVTLNMEVSIKSAQDVSVYLEQAVNKPMVSTTFVQLKWPYNNYCNNYLNTSAAYIKVPPVIDYSHIITTSFITPRTESI